jgi:hypothetical protein
MLLEAHVAAKDVERVKLCDDITTEKAMSSAADKENSRLRVELEVKEEELRKLTHRFTIWKQAEEQRARATKAKLKALTSERDNLRNVRCFHNFICVPCFCVCTTFRIGNEAATRRNREHK